VRDERSRRRLSKHQATLHDGSKQSEVRSKRADGECSVAAIAAIKSDKRPTSIDGKCSCNSSKHRSSGLQYSAKSRASEPAACNKAVSTQMGRKRSKANIRETRQPIGGHKMCSQRNNQSNGSNKSIVTNGKGDSDKMMIW
jgi:hypothetical protein